MDYKATRDFALSLDANDSLGKYRKHFHVPLQANGEEHIYFCGNSLGLQPKKTKDFVDQEINDWANLGVEGHLNAKNPWLPYHEFLSQSYANIVGSKTTEVVAMNTLTVNLHLMMVSFYRPTSTRYKIVIEEDAFPSDIYAVESQIKHHGIDLEKALIKLKPRKGESSIRTEDILDVFNKEGSTISLVMLGGVNYYTGQVFDFKNITASAHCLIAVSGSFNPLPVTVHTMTEPSAILPALISRIAPPIEAAEAGSTNTPSYIDSKRCASKISLS